ncbi:MAG TPA: hypothetical protein PKY50_19735 [Candidatus Competibacter sp.]|nr:hypothetical protein [Candidatus Competibacter sp.]
MAFIDGFPQAKIGRPQTFFIASRRKPYLGRSLYKNHLISIDFEYQPPLKSCGVRRLRPNDEA